ncbi:MAG: HAMP domain-containing histidine kinase [Clostridiales bacterium]|nr:HAMP domain-containing histidine kinase [Clostridiales bacterium]
MLKRLRAKFIVINMSIVTLMLCIILVMVYQFTKANLETASLRTMQNIAEHPLRPGLPQEPGEDVRLPYFVLYVGNQGELTTSGGYYDLTDNEFLKTLVDTIRSSSENFGVLEEYNLRYYRVHTPLNQFFVFADISSEIAALRSLLENCLLIGGVSFLIFLGISIFLAKWAVKPVDQAWQQQRQFVADVSHELKTPLTVIMTNAELIQNPEFDGESRTRFSRSILTMSHQMKGLIEQMLALARTEQPQSHVVYASVDFGKLVSDALLPFEPVFFEKGLTLTSQIQPGLTITGDEALLRQLLEILLDNAQKYAKDKGSTWVHLEKRRKGHCLLTVANEGKAIPQEELQHIFKRFYRTDKARSRNGSFGIGLSIAENIVEQHKGKIWAESKNGMNAFHVEFRCL